MHLILFNHLELLLVLLDEMLAVLVEHVNGNLQLTVCHLVSGNGQTALLDGSETFDCIMSFTNT